MMMLANKNRRLIASFSFLLLSLSVVNYQHGMTQAFSTIDSLRLSKNRLQYNVLSQPQSSQLLLSISPKQHQQQQQRQQQQKVAYSNFRNSRHTTLLTTTTVNSGGDFEKPLNWFQKAKQKFKARPGTYLLIPCIAAVVGWFTNYLAVQMIFYPIHYWGIPLLRKPEVPLGLLGWQGIVPCKTKTMTISMVEMVTTQLLSVEQVFQERLNARHVASLLQPEIPKMTLDIINDLVPKYGKPMTTALWNGMDTVQQSILNHMSFKFLTNLVQDMQANILQVFDLQNCVVSQMLQDRSKLGQLFQKCGQQELDFLTNSGLWFGFLLGLIQMAVALVWENPWSLSIGGGIVGLATNWLALKWIFEPVNPTKFGPFIIQGQFLRRQKEVAVEFSNFFANKILSSPNVWASVLTDPVTSPVFFEMFSKHFAKFANTIVRGLMGGTAMLEPQTLALLTAKAWKALPNHVHVTNDYLNKALDLETTLRVQMEKMSSQQFERVLHPIFEEDELTLILAGAALGFAAGLVQQGLETGQIKMPRNPLPMVKRRIQIWISQIKSRRNNNSNGDDGALPPIEPAK